MVELLPSPNLAVTGILVCLDKLDRYVLVTGDIRALRRPRTMKSGSFELRFAVAMLYELDHLFPQLVIDDFARQYHGRDGIAFMFNEGDSFPRADVIGIRKSSGEPEQLFMKQVDLARNLHCFVSRNAAPEMQLDTVVWIDQSAETWQRLQADDLHVDDLLTRSSRCYKTNLLDLDKIIANVNSAS